MSIMSVRYCVEMSVEYAIRKQSNIDSALSIVKTMGHFSKRKIVLESVFFY